MCMSTAGNLVQPRSEGTSQDSNNNNQSPQTPEFIQIPNFKSNVGKKKTKEQTVGRAPAFKTCLNSS